MKELPDIESLGGLRGKRVVLHAGMNVPVAGGLVVNDFRLKRLLPTLKMLSLAGARTIVIGHLGSEEPKTVEPIAKYFEGELKVRFLGKPPHTLLAKEVNAKDGEVLFAENVRMSPGELECDELLGKHIASLGDVYVNEDFAVSHRPHASIVIPPRYIPCAFGPDFIKEVSELSKVEDPPRPFVAFIGGAKIKTKLPLVESLLKKADKIFICGALANTLYKSMGFEVGLSLADNEIDEGKRILEHENVFVPEDVVVQMEDGTHTTKQAGEVRKGERIMDAGHNSVMAMAEAANCASLVLWNGPLGNFEIGFKTGTDSLASALSEVRAHTILGGGDTIASIESLGILEKFDFVSTGGGAMLDFLAKGTLVGIDAILETERPHQN